MYCRHSVLGEYKSSDPDFNLVANCQIHDAVPGAVSSLGSVRAIFCHVILGPAQTFKSPVITTERGCQSTETNFV